MTIPVFLELVEIKAKTASILPFLIGLCFSYYYYGTIHPWLVGWPLLLMGGFCYAVGILYSAGPRPLSSLPLGEVFSGFTMGFMITLICVYLNTYQQFSWDWQRLAKFQVEVSQF